MSFWSKSIKAYYWNEVPNFGDALAPLLLQRFAGVKKAEWAAISHAQVASIGSILEHIPPLWDGYILGSGRLMENSRLHLVQMTSGVSAKIFSLRGPLSARGIPGSFGLGDPGILADELVGLQDKIYDCGILPHFSDKELVPRFLNMIPKGFNVKVIDPQDDPLTVLREIGACLKIVTSSLHGMIVADAFAVPRRVEYSPKLDKDGGDFKFRDYSASIKMKFETGKVVSPNRFHVEDLKFNVYDAYKALGRVL